MPAGDMQNKWQRWMTAKNRVARRLERGRIWRIWQNRAVSGQKLAANQNGASRVLTTNSTVAPMKIISIEKFFIPDKAADSAGADLGAILSAHCSDYKNHAAMNRQLKINYSAGAGFYLGDLITRFPQPVTSTANNIAGRIAGADRVAQRVK